MAFPSKQKSQCEMSDGDDFGERVVQKHPKMLTKQTNRKYIPLLSNFFHRSKYKYPDQLYWMVLWCLKMATSRTELNHTGKVIQRCLPSFSRLSMFWSWSRISVFRAVKPTSYIRNTAVEKLLLRCICHMTLMLSKLVPFPFSSSPHTSPVQKLTCHSNFWMSESCLNLSWQKGKQKSYSNKFSCL